MSRVRRHQCFPGRRLLPTPAGECHAHNVKPNNDNSSGRRFVSEYHEPDMGMPRRRVSWSLQRWSEACGPSAEGRVMDLQVNHRSGGDAWFSDLLDSCCEGNMDDEDWRFLHGLPTYHCGSWLPRRKKALCEQPGCASFKNRTKKQCSMKTRRML